MPACHCHMTLFELRPGHVWALMGHLTVVGALLFARGYRGYIGILCGFCRGYMRIMENKNILGQKTSLAYMCPRKVREPACDLKKISSPGPGLTSQTACPCAVIKSKLLRRGLEYVLYHRQRTVLKASPA